MPLKPGRSIHRYFLIHTPFYQTSADKKLEWIPYAATGLLKLYGVRTKSTWMKTILISAATEGIRYLLTDSLKKLTHKHRPFPYAGNHSFPSGDTSSSFSSAEFMHQELNASMPFLSCAGYITGAATATIRLMKNRHWLKDVLAGAVIGIISTKLAYLLIGKFVKQKKKKELPITNVTVDIQTVTRISEKIKSPAD
jgi:membrane-associated phospholipid phosphatase